MYKNSKEDRVRKRLKTTSRVYQSKVQLGHQQEKAPLEEPNLKILPDKLSIIKNSATLLKPKLIHLQNAADATLKQEEGPTEKLELKIQPDELPVIKRSETHLTPKQGHLLKAPEAKLKLEHQQEKGPPVKPELKILPDKLCEIMRSETHLETKDSHPQNLNEIKCKLEEEKEGKDVSFTEFIEKQGWGSFSMDFLKDLNGHKSQRVHHSSRLSPRTNIDKLQTARMDFKSIDWFESVESNNRVIFPSSSCAHSDVDNDYVAKLRAKWTDFFAQQKKTPMELRLEERRRQIQKKESVKGANEQQRTKQTRSKLQPRRSLSALYREPRQTHRMRKAMESIAEELAGMNIQPEESGECSHGYTCSGESSCSQSKY
ncbi:uncharacterized protein LOC108162334 [Drosophila miranda]|uniref:uncharacterized protein LOC108162334 n=1 Tax=Drosophila miranda TaxID=7229 RepID=UPI0007E672F0|nr:uncharacterized protein LOC108162334 [Drosophila miranda]